MFHYPSSNDFWNNIPYDCSPIAIEIHDSAVHLGQFDHPERAVYILGAEQEGIPTHILERCKHIITIPSKQCLNVAAAASIVMYDRQNKSG